MSVSAATFVANAATLALPNVTVEALGNQTAHLLYSDGDTAGAVAAVHLPSGQTAYLWPTGKIYVRGGMMKKNEREAVTAWYATLKK